MMDSKIGIKLIASTIQVSFLIDLRLKIQNKKVKKKLKNHYF